MALVKSADVWLLYEDDSVEPVPDSTVQQTFGAASDYTVGFQPHVPSSGLCQMCLRVIPCMAGHGRLLQLPPTAQLA